MPSLAERIATATTKLDTERTAENLSNAAILQRIAGNTTEALQLLQELVEQRTNGNAAAPLLTAQALLDLGSLQRSIGDAPQARLSLEKALALQQAHDPHSSQVAHSSHFIHNHSKPTTAVARFDHSLQSHP